MDVQMVGFYCDQCERVHPIPQYTVSFRELYYIDDETVAPMGTHEIVVTPSLTLTVSRFDDEPRLFVETPTKVQWMRPGDLFLFEGH